MKANPPRQSPAPSVRPDGSFEIDPDRKYVIVMDGQGMQIIRDALDKTGAALGADRGQIFWAIRNAITGQMANPEEIEGLAKGLAEGRKAQAEAQTETADSKPTQA